MSIISIIWTILCLVITVVLFVVEPVNDVILIGIGLVLFAASFFPPFGSSTINRS